MSAHLQPTEPLLLHDVDTAKIEKSARSEAMDWNRIEGNWKQAKGKVREKWGKLTDDDLTKIDGKREQLEGRLQERYGLAKDMARQNVDDWLNQQP
jgi:uncharacterized protein YjbJ (UPF0337 family)